MLTLIATSCMKPPASFFVIGALIVARYIAVAATDQNFFKRIRAKPKRSD
ncbi:hypothetical protein [Xanthomonas campestris]|nr:hypothetical protein [Xanthomonas campestris]